MYAKIKSRDQLADRKQKGTKRLNNLIFLYMYCIDYKKFKIQFYIFFTIIDNTLYKKNGFKKSLNC